MWTFIEIVESTQRNQYIVKKLLFRNTLTSNEQCVLLEEKINEPLTQEDLQKFIEYQSYLLNNLPIPNPLEDIT
jgi:hypothetical protein